MGVKMIKWKPWLPQSSKKFEAQIVIKRLEGLKLRSIGEFSRLALEIKWKGSKGNGLRHLKTKSVRRNYTKEESLREDGVVEWNEEFRSLCSFSGSKDGSFQPWEVKFTIYNYLNQGPDRKPPALGTATINLTECASVNQGNDHVLNVPLSVLGSSIDCRLSYSISFLELPTKESSEPVQKSAASIPLSPSFLRGLTTEKTEPSPLKAGLQKVRKFTRYVSARRAKKASEQEEGSDGKSSDRSEIEYNYPFDTDSLDDLDEGESEEMKEESGSRNSPSTGSFGYVNVQGASVWPNTNSSEVEDLVYYSNRKVDSSGLDHQSLQKSSKRGIVQWRKRNLSFKSPKPKGEPLLRKDLQEVGGDDIDFDRRQLSSSDESSLGWNKTEDDSTASGSSASEFGDDNFVVGSWENKEIISRDGHMKLQTQVFFASIDQRSERAAGESACTALVAVIADWFQSNRDHMPIKSQLDSLIREGSLEWRNLCENETYMERFPDKHFDLDTVLEAKIRPLSVIPEKSFVGFFLPEELEDVEGFDFLRGAMSFDSIWDEISHHDGSGNSCYIVSWNDHFFVLNVEKDAYYIVDTLGERLYEGCKEAFVLKFDRDTAIRAVTKEGESSDDKKELGGSDESGGSDGGEAVLCSGKEACKEYIKSFLAAIPIRELQVDLKKGLVNSSTPLHHRLQIEFHYTQSADQIPSVRTEQIRSVPASTEALAMSALVVV